jgi:hypothetical protein
MTDLGTFHNPRSVRAQKNGLRGGKGLSQARVAQGMLA